MITRLPDCLRRKLGVRGFEFLKADDVGLIFSNPAEQVRQATVDVVDLETGDFHRFSLIAVGFEPVLVGFDG